MKRPNGKLWEAIQNTGLKHYVIAKRCGISEKLLSQHLHGTRQLPPEKLASLAQFLGFAVEDLTIRGCTCSSTSMAGNGAEVILPLDSRKEDGSNV